MLFGLARVSKEWFCFPVFVPVGRSGGSSVVGGALCLVFVYLLLYTNARLITRAFSCGQIDNRPHLLVGRNRRRRVQRDLGSGPRVRHICGRVIKRTSQLLIYPALACGGRKHHLLTISHRTLGHVFSLSFMCQVANRSGCHLHTRRRVISIYSFNS